MLAKNTKAPTPALSVSTSLPEGCVAYRNGLVLREGLTYDEWKGVGRLVCELAGAGLWMVGDWLAYGQKFYLDTVWGKRVPNEIYTEKAAETGYAVQTLTNAKYVCLKVNFSLRKEKLTFTHAMEIAARVPDGQFEYWINRAVEKELTVKALREDIRKSTAKFKTEPNDHGKKSFLETASQFSRDFLSECDSWSPKFKDEVLRILTPVLKKLG